MADNENLTNLREALIRQSAGTINGNGNFSEGSSQKGGVNTAPPCPRPDVTPVAYNNIPAAQNTGIEATQNTSSESAK